MQGYQRLNWKWNKEGDQGQGDILLLHGYQGLYGYDKNIGDYGWNS